jgi:hypothetical protein
VHFPILCQSSVDDVLKKNRAKGRELRKKKSKILGVRQILSAKGETEAAWPVRLNESLNKTAAHSPAH